MTQASHLTEQIRQQLKELGVVLVYLFGSKAEQLDLPHSDLDLAVLIKDNVNARNSLKLYADLYEIFTQVFPSKELDIVFLQTAPLELRFDVISHGQVFFESDQAFRLDFEEKTVRQYADYKPILREFNQAILNRV